MTVSEAIRRAIDDGTEINAEGCYLLAVAIEADQESG
jgi:hypothetical protein